MAIQIKAYSVGDSNISQMRSQVEEGEITLHFTWPTSMKQVYIYRRNRLQDEAFNLQEPYAKYTKEEYAKYSGFKDRCHVLGMMEYMVCPFVEEEGRALVIQYEDERNKIEVATGVIQMTYRLKEKNRLFSKRKSVQMKIFCEVDLPSSTLCYVKKKGGIPSSYSDGTRFAFISDFRSGENVLPEIEVEQDEYIRVFVREEVQDRALYRIFMR